MKRPTTTTRQSMGQHRAGGGPRPQRLSAAALNRKQLASVKSTSGTSTACQRRVTGAESVVTGTTAAGGQSTNLMRSQHHFSNFNMANAAGQRLAGMARHASLTGTGGRATSSHFL